MSRPLTTADALAMVAQKDRRVQHPALLPVGAPVVALSPREQAQRDFDRLNALSKQRALSDDESRLLEQAIRIIDGRKPVDHCAGCGAPLAARRRDPSTDLCRSCWPRALAKCRPDLWTSEMDAALLEGKRDGMTYAEISRTIGRSRVACIARLRLLKARAAPCKN